MLKYFKKGDVNDVRQLQTTSITLDVRIQYTTKYDIKLLTAGSTEDMWHFSSSVRIDASDLLGKSNARSTWNSADTAGWKRFCRKSFELLANAPTPFVCARRERSPWGVLNSFCVSLLQRLTIIFSLEMRGADPNMRPLNTHNKMIIGWWWWSCPSPCPLNRQLIVIDYLCISYIYHFWAEAHGDVSVHVHLICVCEWLSVGVGQLRLEIIMLQIISSFSILIFSFLRSTPHFLTCALHWWLS